MSEPMTYSLRNGRVGEPANGRDAVLDIEAVLEHDGSGYAVTKTKITSAGKKVCDAQLKLRTMPFAEVPLADIVRKRAGEVGLFEALAASAEGK